MQERDIEHAFEAFFDEVLPQAQAAAYRLVGSRAEAEDIAAEALARAYSRWSHIVRLPYRTAWVLRVATNLALDSLRKKRPQLEESTALHIEEQAVLRVTMSKALRRLPRRQREAVVLRHVAGLPEQEVATVLGI